MWFTPVALAALLLGRDSVYVDQGLFFSGAALVTFGGAYAVLAYVAQQAVEVYGWLAPGEMVSGLALAETTPGPLIMVVQFVGGLGAYRDPGAVDPWVGMLLGSLLVTWVTFVPCFLFIFLGAPYVERLRDNHHLTAALTGITAAVVGVIASLAVFFALHTLFDDTRVVAWGPATFEVPVLASWDPLAFAPHRPRAAAAPLARLDPAAHARAVRRDRPGGRTRRLSPRRGPYARRGERASGRWRSPRSWPSCSSRSTCDPAPPRWDRCWPRSATGWEPAAGWRAC